MKQILCFVAAALIFASCEKVEKEKYYQDLLRNGSWKQTSGTYKFRPPTATVDSTVYYYDSLGSCKKDDYLVFQINFDGLVHEGGSKCNTSDRTETPFTWDISGDGTVMHVFKATEHFETDNVNGKVMNISENSFTIQYVVYQTYSGVLIPTTFTNTYVRQ
jgi:hypothetical protein